MGQGLILITTCEGGWGWSKYNQRDGIGVQIITKSNVRERGRRGGSQHNQLGPY